MRAGIVGVLLGVLLGAGCASQPLATAGPREKITVAVAASAHDVIAECARPFEAETGIAVELMPGASSQLARQIANGAPVDLFLCADQPNADYLQERQYVVERTPLLGNRLVVIVPAARQLSLEKLTDLADNGVQRLALAVEKVPAGEYARQALRRAGVWEQVKDRLLGGEDVRATLAFVERGADAGIVYRTDTVGNTRVRVCFEVDPALHAPIEYPLLLLHREPLKPGARRFQEFLKSERAAAIFRRAEFIPLQQPLQKPS